MFKMIQRHRLFARTCYGAGPFFVRLMHSTILICVFSMATACGKGLQPVAPNLAKSEAEPNAATSENSPPNGDTGFGTGLWVPSGTTGVYVVDQSGNGVNDPSNSTIVPGCVNGGPMDWDDECRLQIVYRNVVQLTQGKVISVRYRVKADAPIAGRTGEMSVNSFIGGGLHWKQTVSLSAVPGDFSDPACTLVTNRTPRLLTGDDYCPIARDHEIYYFNIRLDQPCDQCAFVIQDNVPELD